MNSNVSPRIPAAVATFLPLLEHVGEGIQIFDEDGCLLYANKVAAQNLGFQTPQVLMTDHQGQFQGLNIVTFSYPTGQVLELSEYPCVRALKGEQVAEQVLQFTDHQHQDRRLAIQAMPLRDETGAVRYGAVLSRNLTEVETAMLSGRQETPHLHQIVNVLPSLVAYLNQQEQHIYANHSYLKAFRVLAESLPGSTLQSVVGPVIYQQLRQPLKQAFSGEIADVCLPIGSGQPRLQYKRVSVVPRFEGQVVAGVYLILGPVTAHQHTDDLLQTETNFLRYSLEAAAVGTWDWHLLDQELLWSLPQERLFGLSPGSFDGQPETFLQLVHEGDRDFLEAAIAAATQTQQQFAAEFRVILPDRKIRWLNQRGQVVSDSQGQVVRMVGVTFDITAQHTAKSLLMKQMSRDRLIAKLAQDISRTEQVNQLLPEAFGVVREHLELDRLVLIDLRAKPGKAIIEEHIPAVKSMMDWEMRHPWSVKPNFLEKFQLGHPVSLSNLHQQSLSDSELGFWTFFDVGADLSIPLLDGEQLWGLLSAQSRQPRDWLPEETRLLETVGRLFSTAIQRDRLHANLTRANRELERFAYLDGLTQVANRRRFEHFLNQEWRRLMREQSSMALIMVDIDHFKAYNDIYGHQAGDNCLRRVAGILRSAIQRPADIVARYGGEEFALVLPNTDIQGAETIAAKIRVLLHQAQIPHKGSPVSQLVTVSSGIAAIYPHPLKAPDDLISIADQALYQAKEKGRNCIVAFSSPQSASVAQ
ncbi:MAG: diguanylate cyclase [Cyanobacteria bacterium P01_C01_bin.147]